MNTVCIIEDHPIIVSGMKQIALEKFPSAIIRTFDTFSGLEEFICHLHQRAFIIADIHLGNQNILDLLMQLQLQKKNIKILLYTHSDPWELGLEKKEFPFWGYIKKSCAMEIIHFAFENVTIIEQYLSKDLPWQNPLVPTEIKLTKREKQILLLLKKGLSNKEIGDQLFLSELTVKSHRQNMIRKLDVKNLAELIIKTSQMLG